MAVVGLPVEHIRRWQGVVVHNLQRQDPDTACPDVLAQLHAQVCLQGLPFDDQEPLVLWSGIVKLFVTMALATPFAAEMCEGVNMEAAYRLLQDWVVLWKAVGVERIVDEQECVVEHVGIHSHSFVRFAQ